MTTIRIAALATALALSLVAAPDALAASQIGTTNEFVSNDGKVSFSLSLTKSAGPVGSVDVPSFDARTTQSSSQTLLGDIEGGTRAVLSLSVTGSGQKAQTLSGAGTGVNAPQAPITENGTPFEGTYYALQDGGNSGRTSATLNIRTSGNSNIGMRSYELLWGSVGAEDVIDFTGIGGTVLGAEVLAAAQALGIAGGNQGSYYVTFNVLGGQSTTGINGRSGTANSGTNTMEFVVLNAAQTENYAARDSYVDGQFPSDGSGEGASPAPLPALGGTIPGVLLAMGALRRRFRRAA